MIPLVLCAIALLLVLIDRSLHRIAEAAVLVADQVRNEMKRNV